MLVNEPKAGSSLLTEPLQNTTEISGIYKKYQKETHEKIGNFNAGIRPSFFHRCGSWGCSLALDSGDGRNGVKIWGYFAFKSSWIWKFSIPALFLLRR